jgi:hypothetical protein
MNIPTARLLRHSCIGFLSFLMVACSSDVENALSQRLGDSEGFVADLAISSVQCVAPQKDKLRTCIVEFSKEYSLPNVIVDLPSDTAGFPAEFKMEQRFRSNAFIGNVYSVDVTTGYGGATQPLKDTASALVVTTRIAVDQATHSAGEPYIRQREKLRNLRSYKPS